VVDRGNPDEGSDLAAVEMAKFGQLGDQGRPPCLADAGHAGQEIGIGLPSAAFADRTVRFEFEEFGLQQGEMPFDRLITRR
jgi:hypothetical protein